MSERSRSTEPRAWRPTPAEIAAAEDRTVPDVIAPGLRILFCGINPGLYSGATGHHFARPGNRFWKALHASRLTPVLVSPFAERDLLARGLGVTNLVDRATATADRLAPEELRRGAARLAAKVRRHRPAVVAFLGLGAYRTAYDRPRAPLGLQEETIGPSRIWLLPNPSGLNAGYSLEDLVRELAALRRAAARFARAGATLTATRDAAAPPRRGAGGGSRRAEPGRGRAR